jgi:hypothetical protein
VEEVERDKKDVSAMRSVGRQQTTGRHQRSRWDGVYSRSDTA